MPHHDAMEGRHLQPYDDTAFPLTGAHTTQACSACHVNNVYNGTATNCDGCHLADYNGDDQPEPRDRRVPEGLQRLPHAPPSGKARPSTTPRHAFPLTGAHTTVPVRAAM